VVNVDNRVGYGALKLGMTLEEARAAGLTGLTWDSPQSDGTCVANLNVAISKKFGVVRISLPAEAKTYMGIGVGSTFAEVKRAYPDASEYRAGWSARVGDNASYSFIGGSTADGHFADTDKVVRIRLTANDADCITAML
jgi:hypothetical protein